MPTQYYPKVMICEVGPDIYGATGGSKSPELINKCWQWIRQNQEILGVKEHLRNL